MEKYKIVDGPVVPGDIPNDPMFFDSEFNAMVAMAEFMESRDKGERLYLQVVPTIGTAPNKRAKPYGRRFTYYFRLRPDRFAVDCRNLLTGKWLGFLAVNTKNEAAA